MHAKNILFHTIILGTIMGLCALGVWQLARREWKHHVMQVMTQNLSLRETALLETIAPSGYWRKVMVPGTLNQRKAIYIPRFTKLMDADNGSWGYEIYAPLTLKDGRVFIYRLGWAHEKLRPADQKLISENFHAVIHPFDKTMNFMGASHPLDERNHADTDLYADFGAPAQDFYLDAYAQNSPDKNEFYEEPVPLWQTPELPDNHLQYALTWFALAAVLSALYLYKIDADRRHLSER